MLIKSLLLGLFFTLGIFAVKSGLGLFYSIKHKNFLKIFLISTFSYLCLFALSYFILIKVDFLKYFTFFEKFLKSAMWIHLLLAFGMIWWGINLLFKKDSEKSSAYLLLVIPCPFCSLAIFLSISFILKFQGDYSLKFVFYLFLFFILIQLLTITLLKFFKINDINEFLGYTLICLGLYFIITYCTAPVFSNIHRIYSLAKYSNSLNFVLSKKYIATFLIFIVIGCLGYLWNLQKVRKD